MQARIKRLTLHGFKSFYDRTDLVFDAPVSAVVGPNGCGKSNISDAINWVLGEQSAKSLRGGKMEDVIFNGSAQRKPLGMAEIQLDFVLRDDEGRERESQISRRLYRTGESEYLVNGVKVRLKDVSEFLHDLAIGARTYAVIEQGKIDEVLKAKPEERRELLEEAAGIAKFRVKKRSAESKLALTQENLTRIVDILKELETQLSSLKRQAQRAEQYRKLENELADAKRFYYKAATLLTARLEHEAAAARQLAEDSYARAAAERGRTAADLEKGRRGLEEGETRLRSLQAEAHQTELAIQEQNRVQSLASNQLLNLKSRKSTLSASTGTHKAEFESAVARADEIGAQAAAAQSTYDGAAAALRDAESRVDTARATVRDERESHARHNQALFMAGQRAARAKADLEAIAAALDRHGREGEAFLGRIAAARETVEARQAALREMESTAASARAALESAAAALASGKAAVEARRAEARAADEALRAAQREHDALAARRRSLAELLEQRTDYSQEARTVLSLLSGRARGFADELKLSDAAWRPALEALLGPLAEAVSVDGVDAADHAILELRQRKLGQIYIHLHSEGKPLDLSRHAGLTAPSRLLAPGHAQGRVLDALGALAPDRVTALAAQRAGFGAPIATRDGELLLPAGFLKAGGEGRSSLILKRQEDLAECDAQLAAADAKSAAAKSARDSAEQALHDAQHAHETLEAARREREQARLEGEIRARTAAEELARQQRALSELEAARQRTDEEQGALHERRALSEAAHAEAEESGRNASTSLESAVLRIGELESELEKQLHALAEQRTGVAVAQSRLQSVTADQALALQQRAAAEQRMIAAEEELLQIERSILDEETRVRQAETAIGELSRKLQATRDELSTLEGNLLNLRAEVRHLEGEARLKDEAVETLGNELNDRRLAHNTLENDLRHLLAEAREALSLEGEQDPRALEGVEVDEPALDQRVAGDARERMRKLADRQQKFGPVNLMALDEYAEVEKRHSFLDGQKQDLDKSIAELQSAIAEINETTRERFQLAYEAVAKNFHDIFTVLFSGGEARVKLTDESNLLESGIEIFAMPPGKKLTSLNLLSGGERALTTLAFLFAIFRYKPAPFCLMDETDAPLDDANVERYKRLLAEFRRDTQFILITHNRATMSSADNLFGITMEEPGISKVVTVKMDARLPVSAAEAAGAAPQA